METGSSVGQPPPGTTLFTWVKTALREAIERQDYTPGQPFVTQREIVERFGVSTTTAVRALNDLVADGLVVRRRGRGTFVVDTAGSLEPDAAQGAVAFVSPDDVDAHQVAIRSGIAAECELRGRPLMVATTRDLGSEEAVLDRVVDQGARGLIVFAWDRSRAAPALERLRRRGVAVVLVDRYLPSMASDAVVFDDFAIGYDVTAALLDRGHRALAVLWSEEDVTSVRDRLSGHYRALRERGLPELPERSALKSYTALASARRQARLRSLLEGPDAPTAIIGGNAATMNLAASDLLRLAGGFPGTVELANMDELGANDASPLAVVSATLPAREMGVTALRLLHERMNGSAVAQRHLVLPARVSASEPGRNTLSITGRH